MKIQSRGASPNSAVGQEKPEPARASEVNDAAAVAPAAAFSSSQFEPPSPPPLEAAPLVAPPVVREAGLSEQDGAFIDSAGRLVLAQSYRDVTPVRSSFGRGATRPVLYVNGMTTPLDYQRHEMQELANQANYRVVGIRNETALQSENPAEPRFWVAVVADLLEAGLERLGVTRSPPARRVAKEVLQALDNGEAIHLVAQSQGAIMVASALWSVRKELMIGRDLSAEAAEALLRHVSVETFGSAQATFPDGPRYVHYVNDTDLVAGLLGPTQAAAPRPSQASSKPDFGPPVPEGGPGRGAVVVHFKWSDPESRMTGHMLPVSLWFHRPFEEVWAEGQKHPAAKEQ